MQQLYLELRLHVDPVVVLRGLAVDVLLPVLAHHDDWRGAGRLERKREIEKNERVGVPPPHHADQVGGYPDEQDTMMKLHDPMTVATASAILCPSVRRATAG